MRLSHLEKRIFLIIQSGCQTGRPMSGLSYKYTIFLQFFLYTIAITCTFKSGLTIYLHMAACVVHAVWKIYSPV
jgi:hypothetical protein